MDTRYRQTDGINDEAIRALENNQILHLYRKLSKGARRFVNKAIRINQSGRGFSFPDFPEIKKSTFKTRVFALRNAGLVETVAVSGCGFYRVRGIRLNPEWERSTTKGTGVGIIDNEQYLKQHQLYEYLKEYLSDLDKPALHNIRLHFYSNDYLYEKINSAQKEESSYDIHYEPRNKSFIIDPTFDWGRHFAVKVIVTPNSLVQVMIKNTFMPLAYDENGIYELLSKLGEIRRYLTRFSREIPQVTEWLFVRADFGRDSKKPLGRMFAEIQLRDFAGALIRIYAKEWPDGERRMRVERIISPNKPMQEFLKTVKSKIEITTKITEL